jgi:hypothetical protein
MPEKLEKKLGDGWVEEWSSPASGPLLEHTFVANNNLGFLLNYSPVYLNHMTECAPF